MRKLPSLRKTEPQPEPPAEPPGPPTAKPSSAPRFGIKTLMLLTLVIAFATAGYGALRRSSGGSHEFYVVFSLAAPLIALVVVGLLQQLLRPRR